MSSGDFSQHTIARLVAVLPLQGGLTPREITRRVEILSPKSVYEALAVLTRHGLADFDGEPGRRRYRRKAS